jgi:GNAT superfamily N-acetyltransferase
MSEYVIAAGFQERDRAGIVAMLREYEADIGISLDFQGFEAELAGLPGAYAPPAGGMVVARGTREGDLAGCVALRGVEGSPGLCEMKRLYVRPAARGSGLGRMLANAVIGEARRLGYRRMCLDTLPSLTSAQTLYRSLGFRHIGVAGSDPTVLLFELEL